MGSHVGMLMANMCRCASMWICLYEIFIGLSYLYVDFHVYIHLVHRCVICHGCMYGYMYWLLHMFVYT